MRVKICGITQADQGVAIAHLGATALGFICVPASPRYVAPEAISQIVDALQVTIQQQPETVGVFADAELAAIETAVKTGKLSGVQLHGSESVEVCQRIRQHLPGIRVIKALRVQTAADLSQAAQYAHHVDALLLDAYHPQLLGGTGQTLDWASLQSFKPTCPWLLAGGLTPDNVAAALVQLSPDGIDLSSGVEISPGIKDLDRVKLLFERLRPWL